MDQLWSDAARGHAERGREGISAAWQQSCRTSARSPSPFCPARGLVQRMCPTHLCAGNGSASGRRSEYAPRWKHIVVRNRENEGCSTPVLFALVRFQVETPTYRHASVERSLELDEGLNAALMRSVSSPHQGSDLRGALLWLPSAIFSTTEDLLGMSRPSGFALALLRSTRRKSFLPDLAVPRTTVSP